MRAFFLALLLANIGLWVWSTYFSSDASQSDPAPLSRQLAPDSVRILPPGKLPPKPPAEETASSPAEAAPANGKPAGAAPAGGPLACLEWGSFSPVDAEAAEKALGALALGNRVSVRRSEEVAGWWVFIPSQGTREWSQKKSGELKALGIDEFFVVQEPGRFRFAVSLGVFKTEDAARARLESLRAKGVRTAQVGPRDAAVQKTWFQVRNVDEALAAKLKDLAQKPPGAELRECPTPKPAA